jgi:sarcosine oxidase subunit beta
VWLGTKKPGIHLQLAQASLGLFENFLEKHSGIAECEIGGEMLLIETEEELEFMHDFVAGQQQAEIDVRLLTKSETRKIQPDSSEQNIAGSTYSPKGFSLNSINLVYAFTEAAKRRGAKILRNTQVESIRLSGNRIQSVVTHQEEIITDFVVNATGPSAPKIGKMVGLEIPIVPLRGEILVTETMPPIVRIPVTEAGYITVKRNPELVKKMSKSGATSGISQSDRGNVYIGASKQFVGFNTCNSSGGMADLAQRAVHFFPALSGARVIRAYAGLRPYTSDGLPILGSVPEIDGFIMAAGHGGDGVALSMITGKLITELIIKGETSIGIEKLSIKRFAPAADTKTPHSESIPG